MDKSGERCPDVLLVVEELVGRGEDDIEVLTALRGDPGVGERAVRLFLHWHDEA